MSINLALKRRGRLQQPSPSTPLVTSSRGIRIRIRRRVARFFWRAMGRASKFLSRWWVKLRGNLHRVNPGLGLGYVRLGEQMEHVRRAPKGHLAVYVGSAVDGGMAPPKRVVVPLIYVNHPLFKRLLEDTGEKYGYDHPGGLTVHCPVSEFETVKTRIASDRARMRQHSLKLELC